MRSTCWRRTALLTTASALGLGAGTSRDAQAGPPPAPSPWEFAVFGTFLTTQGDKYPSDHRELRPAGNGGGIQAYVSYDLTPNWDLRLTGSGNWLSDYYSYEFSGRQATHVNYYYADFDAGYNLNPCPNTSLRLAGGVEYANFASTFSEGFFSSGVYHYFGGLKNSFWGVGPHASVEGSYAFGRSGFSAVGWLDGSALFGDLSQSGEAAHNSNTAGGRTAFGLRAYAGFAYALPVQNVDASVNLGFQVQQWWNVNSTAFGDQGTSHASELFYGPLAGFEVHF